MDLPAVSALLSLAAFVVSYTGIAAGSDVYTHTWAVRVERGLPEQVVGRIAREAGFLNAGKILELEEGDVYLFAHPRVAKRSAVPQREIHSSLIGQSSVLWAEQQMVKRRVKRDLQFNDPLWRQTWYLNNGARGGFDMNVKAAWNKGFTGRGIVVTVLDDGLEWLHPDLHGNYDQDASVDINNSTSDHIDRDPTPRYDWTNENRHGTRCAGEIAAAANNGICSVGVAYNARVGGVRMLDGDVTDSVEAQSLSLNPQHIDIYSASWGPDDNGRTVDGPGSLARAAFLNGITQGRGGKGSLFVWASGNGGAHGDSCACDGYTNNPYTLSVSSASQSNMRPWYLEECASTLASTYSSGANGGPDDQVVTTDLRHACTLLHTGTSASAPLAAGIVALTLEANPRLTWRDMQYIVLMTANPRPLADGHWSLNGVGRKVSHLYGYGLMDAGAMVDLAQNWTMLPQRKMWQSTKVSDSVAIGNGVQRTIAVPQCQPGEVTCVRHLEHVQLVITAESSRRGSLRIVLRSPAGTSSTVLPPRRSDDSSGSFTDWAFTSVHFWGELSTGDWIVDVHSDGFPGSSGTLESYQLVLFGTAEDPLVQCHPECHRPCTGPGSDQCSECVHYRFNGSCVELCPTGHYPDSSLRTCLRCPVANCQACDGDNPAQCKTCAAGHLLLDASRQNCVQNCPAGSWPDADGGRCVLCSQAHCTACVDGTSCSACAAGYEWFTPMATCLDICPAGSYRAAADSYGRCQLCHATCTTCHGPLDNDCDTCSQSLYLYNATCSAVCPDRTYPQDGVCQSCHHSCHTCNGPSNNNCLSCSNDSVTLTVYNECLILEPCTSRQFRHGSSACISCHATCLACTGQAADECTDCLSDGAYRFLTGNGRCVEACEEHEYASNRTCVSCEQPCQRCVAGEHGRHRCTKCADGWLLQDGLCASTCGDGSYASEFAECKRCHESCATCSGDGDTDCLRCAEEKLLEGGACVSNCSAGFYMSERAAEEGSTASSSRDCLPCHHSCASCHGQRSDECKSCHDPLIIKRGSCVTRPVCHSDQFYDSQLRECVSCHAACASCSGPAQHHCTACRQSMRLDDTDGSCLVCCGRHGKPLLESANHTLCCPCGSMGRPSGKPLDPECIPEETTTPTPANSGIGAVVTGVGQGDAGGSAGADAKPSASSTGSGLDVLHLEREVNLMSMAAAIIGALTVAGCIAYGAAVAVLQARSRGACGARCSSGGVVYVQVDTNADTYVTAKAQSMDDEDQSCEDEDDSAPAAHVDTHRPDAEAATMAFLPGPRRSRIVDEEDDR